MKTLILKEIKANYKIFIIFALIISMYGSIIVAMYDPELGKSLNMMAESMPQLFEAFGMQNPGLTMMDFIINYLYGFILIVIPFVFVVIMSYRLIARYIDKGSMAYLLTTGLSRIQVILSELIVFIIGVFALIAYATILIYLCSYMMFDEGLEIGKFVLLNIDVLCLQLLFVSLCYLFACCFDELKYSLGVGAGLGFVFILIQMLSQVSEDIEFMKYLTPLTLFNAKGIVAFDTMAIIQMVVLFLLACILIIIAIIIFNKRDLSL